MKKRVIKMFTIGLLSFTIGIAGFSVKSKAVTSTGNLDGSYCSASLYTISSGRTVEGDLSCSGAILNISVSNTRALGYVTDTFYASGSSSYTGSYSVYATDNNWAGSVFVSGTGDFKATKPTGSTWVRNLSI